MLQDATSRFWLYNILQQFGESCTNIGHCLGLLCLQFDVSKNPLLGHKTMAPVPCCCRIFFQWISHFQSNTPKLDIGAPWWSPIWMNKPSFYPYCLQHCNHVSFAKGHWAPVLSSLAHPGSRWGKASLQAEGFPCFPFPLPFSWFLDTKIRKDPRII